MHFAMCGSPLTFKFQVTGIMSSLLFGFVTRNGDPSKNAKLSVCGSLVATLSFDILSEASKVTRRGWGPEQTGDRERGEPHAPLAGVGPCAGLPWPIIYIYIYVCVFVCVYV